VPRSLPIAPLNYLVRNGARAASIATLTSGVLLIAIAVAVIISILVAIAVWRRKPLIGEPGDRLPVGLSGGGMSVLWTGVGGSTLMLLFTMDWTLVVLAACRRLRRCCPIVQSGNSSPIFKASRKSYGAVRRHDFACAAVARLCTDPRGAHANGTPMAAHGADTWRRCQSGYRQRVKL
jgi:hypothetical protein